MTRMTVEMEVATNRIAIRSRIEEVEGMIRHIEARRDITDDVKALATDGLYELVDQLETHWHQPLGYI